MSWVSCHARDKSHVPHPYVIGFVILASCIPKFPPPTGPNPQADLNPPLLAPRFAVISSNVIPTHTVIFYSKL
eukprot:4204890-Amphidinium_carterae.1